MMSSKLEWNEFLGLYSQINNCPSMSSSPRPTAGFENYLFSPEKIRDTCSGNSRRTRRSPRGRATNSVPSITSCSSSPSPSSRGSDRSYSPSSSSFSSSSRSHTPCRGRDLSYPHSSSFSSSRTGSTNSYVSTSRGRDRRYSSSSSSSSSSWSSSRSRNPYKYIPPPEPDRQGNYVYLPLRDALRILSDVQKTLEDACFYFGDQHLQKLLEENEWDCPEAVELNAWVAVFFQRDNFKLLCRFSQYIGYENDLGDLLESIKEIRHATVHRHRLTVTTIRVLVQDAIALCRILGQGTCLKELHAIWGAASIQIDQLYENSRPCPPPEPSTLQIPSTPKLLPVSQRKISTEEDDRSTEAGSDYTESTTTTTYSKEHLFWQRRTWQ